MATPFSIPNKEVKRCSADDTLMKGKVGNRQLGVFDFLYTRADESRVFFC